MYWIFMQTMQRIFNFTDIIVLYFFLDKIWKLWISLTFLPLTVAKLPTLKNSPFLANPVCQLIFCQMMRKCYAHSAHSFDGSNMTLATFTVCHCKANTLPGQPFHKTSLALAIYRIFPILRWVPKRWPGPFGGNLSSQSASDSFSRFLVLYKFVCIFICVKLTAYCGLKWH